MRKLICIINLHDKTGGVRRAKFCVLEYSKRGLVPQLVVPKSSLKDIFLLPENKVYFSRRIIGTYSLPCERFSVVIGNYLTSFYKDLIHIKLLQEKINNIKLVFSLHETYDALYVAYLISKKLNIKVGSLLQLPPFYGNKKRLYNILSAYKLWYKILFDSYSSNILKFYKLISNYYWKRKITNLLKKFDFLIAVSRSITLEMGEEWQNKTNFYILDPGVTLSECDVELIQKIKKNTEKKNIVIFGGRPDPNKGLQDALIIWEKIYKKLNNYKLIITGQITNNIKTRILKYAKKVGIKESIIFTGFLPREERLKLVAKARLMLYPSHIDSVSYSVLESLYLGTPVVAYDIPAIKLYYFGLEGIEIIKELDIEAMIQKALEMLEKENIKVETPKFKSWKEIMDEEVNIIKNFLE